MAHAERSGNDLTLDPRVQGTFVVVSAKAERNAVVIETRTNSGTTNRFRFVAVSYD